MTRAFGVVMMAAALLLAACHGARDGQADLAGGKPEVPVVATPVKITPAKTAEACKAQNGDWRRVCMMGNYMCVSTFADAGKTCSSSSECGGRCLAEGSPDFGAKVTGKCSVNNDPCGCFQTVENGEAQPGLCVD
jgi:hypothetical protein